jgi:hypothetical protein
MAEPRAHATLGASSAHRWLNCPGSVRLCAELPDTSSDYAAEGTAAHELAEKCLSGNLRTAVNFEGDVIEADGRQITVTREMIEAVDRYLFEVWQHAGVGNRMYVEQRFALDRYGPDMFGTNDAAVLKTGEAHLHVFDFKYGAGVPVDVEGNPQLLYYALGAVEACGGAVETVTVHVVQPRCGARDDKVRSWSIDFLDLYAWGETLRAAAEATRKPDAPLAAGDWCRFCKARGTCPKLFEEAITGAGDDPSALSPAELGERLRRADVLETWIKAVREHAYAEAQAGRTPSGFKLVDKVARRKWALEDPVPALRAIYGGVLSGTDLYDHTPVGVPAFEKLCKAQGLDFGKAASAIDKTSSGTTLVPESDRRPAVLPAAVADEFDVLG